MEFDDEVNVVKQRGFTFNKLRKEGKIHTILDANNGNIEQSLDAIQEAIDQEGTYDVDFMTHSERERLDNFIRGHLQKHICYCFGGGTWHSSWAKHEEKLPMKGEYEPYCYMSIFDLQANTEGNTCEELNGLMRDTSCGFPLINVEKLRERKHPKYYDNPLDQRAYQLLVESAQARSLEKEYADRKYPGREQRAIDEISKYPIGGIHVVTGVKEDKIETKKITDLTLTKESAKKLLNIVPNILLEMDAKERFARKEYGVFYNDLASKEQAKIRYRINKFFKEFK